MYFLQHIWWYQTCTYRNTLKHTHKRKKYNNNEKERVLTVEITKITTIREKCEMKRSHLS